MSLETHIILHFIGNSSKLKCQHFRGVFLPYRCILTAEQLRAARAMLRMDQSALAVASGVSVETIKRLEGMEGHLSEVRVATINAISATLESAGIEFIDENGGGAGVRLKKSSETVADLTRQIDTLQADMTPEPGPEKPSPNRAMKQLRRAHDQNELAALKSRRAKSRKEEMK
jgi:transcriptional regulator with XRE-family HTH domain